MCHVCHDQTPTLSSCFQTQELFTSVSSAQSWCLVKGGKKNGLQLTRGLEKGREEECWSVSLFFSWDVWVKRRSWNVDGERFAAVLHVKREHRSNISIAAYHGRVGGVLHCKQSTCCLSQSRAVWTIKKNRTCKRRFRGKSTIFFETPQQWAASTPPRLPCFAGCFWTGNSHIECQKGSLTWTYHTSYMLQKSCFSFACTAICYFFQVPVFRRVFVFCKLLPWEPRNASRSELRHMETIVWWQPQNMRATFN